MAITKTDYVTFTVFAVPETIEGLTLEFHLGEDGSEIQTATLKKNVGGGVRSRTSRSPAARNTISAASPSRAVGTSSI